MRSKIGLNLAQNYSYNFDLSERSKKNIRFIIIHYTGMKKESNAIKKLCDSRSNVSAHFFIKKNGNILNLVPASYVAWHAGKSCWKKYKSLNRYSIGVEISNSGHDHGYEKFSSSQLSSLIKLLKKLTKEFHIEKKKYLGSF